MLDITPTSELEAVNEMLASIGQAPVATLDDVGITDANIARRRLSAQTRKTLLEGFVFNTDDAYTLSPDTEGYIVIPANALSVESTDASAEYTERRAPNGRRCLYNKTDGTFEFTSPVDLEIVWGFAFEDLPEPARSYIAIAAGRRFQSKFIGSQILDRFEEEDELRAWTLLQRAERRVRKTNLFRGNAGMASRINNRSY